jgi:hypothetical protein
MILVERYVAGGHVNVSCCKAKKEEAIGLYHMGGLVDVANCDLSEKSGRFPLQLPSDTIRTRLEFLENFFLGYVFLIII